MKNRKNFAREAEVKSPLESESINEAFAAFCRAVPEDALPPIPEEDSSGVDSISDCPEVMDVCRFFRNCDQ